MAASDEFLAPETMSAVNADPHAHYFGTELGERILVPGDEATLGEVRFDEWLSRTVAPDPDRTSQTAVAVVITRPPAW